MALLRVDWFSDVLEMSTSAVVLLPQATESQIGVQGGAPVAAQGFPTLYLLHGLSDDATAWTRYSSIERYAEAAGLAVVMPQVGRSFYIDAVHGGRWWTHVSEELPAVMGQFFRLSDRREDTFVAGLSMGGYGAVKWALQQPERFAAAVSMSGALDLAELQESGALHADIADAVLDGRQVAGSADDLLHLLRQRGGAGAGEVPALYVGCGTDDALLEHSTRFVELAGSLGLDVTTSYPSGGHEWSVWDAMVQDVLDWVPRP